MKINPLRDGRVATILLVEDNDDHAELMKIGFEDAHFAVDLHHVRNGEECMAFLRQEGKYAGAHRPDLVLLDLNMPRMDGREVLGHMKQDNDLQSIPVVVLTSSESNADISEAYKLGCNSYIAKPVDFVGLSKVVQSITDYWFTLVVVPPASS